MISAVRTTDRSLGFTLIEVVVVLAIAAVMMGGAVGLMIYSSDERSLRDAGGRIELMAKQARTTAILRQTPYALEFRQGIVRLLPFAQAGIQQKRGRPLEVPQESEEDSNRQFNLDESMSLSVRRWNSNDWLPAAKESVHVWRFDPDGLCEPISVRLNIGESFSVDTYHPLTATVTDSELEAR